MGLKMCILASLQSVTDRRTDGQIFHYIVLCMHSMLMRDKNDALYVGKFYAGKYSFAYRDTYCFIFKNKILSHGM